jgi:pilus assembly protein CpaC
MRKTLQWVGASVAAILIAGTVATAYAQRAETRGGPNLQVSRDSVLRIPPNASFPLSKRLDLGIGRSIVVQFPIPLKDVLVSDPQLMDAVVQSSDRVFLIAKKQGQTNAFFFDEYGQQILTLEVAVGADLSALDELLARIIPGSNVHSEIAGNAIILTGSVRSPVDSDRAAQIAAQFVAANAGSIGTTTSVESTTTTTDVVPANTGAGGATSTYGTQTQAASGSGSGAAVSAYAEKPIINLISVEGEEQVMLRVSVAEVQRSALKQFGINLGALVNSGNFTTAILTDNAFPLTGAAGLGSLPLAGTAASALNLFNNGPGGSGVFPGVAGAAPFGNSGVATGWQSGNQAVAGALRALERDGLLRTLAEPNLTAVSGEPAKFLAGGEYPIPIVSSFGQVSVEYKKYGIALAFTPVVMSEGRISLKIETEVSELTNEGAVEIQGFSIPALKTRQADSTVELPSGGSLALAGLLSESTRQNIDGFPGLKDVPILGTLFRSRDYQKAETELVVIVTPYAVRPRARQELARPLDGLGEPSDRKADFLGHINNVYGGGAPAPVGDLKGDYGFIVE